MLELCAGAAALSPPPPMGDDDTWFRLCDKFNELDDALYEVGIGDVWLNWGMPAIACIWLKGWPAMCGGKPDTPGGKPKPRPSGERCEAAWNPDKNRFLCISAAYICAAAKWRSRSSRSRSFSRCCCSFSRCSFSRCSRSRCSLSRCSLKHTLKINQLFIIFSKCRNLPFTLFALLPFFALLFTLSFLLSFSLFLTLLLSHLFFTKQTQALLLFDHFHHARHHW